MILRSECRETFKVLSAVATGAAARWASTIPTVMALRPARRMMLKGIVDLSVRRLASLGQRQPELWGNGDGGAGSNLHLFIGEHARDGGACQHAILKRTIGLQVPDRQLAPQAPGVEGERVGIEHGVLVGKPLPAAQGAIDLLKVAVKGLAAHVL